MSSNRKNNSEEMLERLRVGEIPLLMALCEKLGLRDLLQRYIKPHGNEKIPAVDTLLLLLFNMTSGRQPLYELEEWVRRIDPRLFGYACFEEGIFNDDRFARMLDKLYFADRASLMTEIAMAVVTTFKLDLRQIHNDSTTIKAYGKIPGKTRSGLQLARGSSKDHRPDLRQLVFSLTISNDGAVPIHYKTYPGNRTDVTTHIETWNRLNRIIGRPDFLYVADCKICSHKQLSHIVRHGGRVITVIPESWKEVKAFKNELRMKWKKNKKQILRVPLPGIRNKYETFSCFLGTYSTIKGGYSIHWIHSTEKKKRDRKSREDALQRAESDLTELMGKLNTRRLKTKEAILERVKSILDKHDVAGLYHVKVFEVKPNRALKASPRFVGKNIKKKMTVITHYALAWARNRESIDVEKNTDGIFPLLCTDPAILPKQALQAYKYQPKLEKRFSQLKGTHNAAPLLFKKIERVEAIMFVFFLALILQAALEREVRSNMKQEKIDAIPVYPEHRIAYHPTTAKIIDRFYDLSLYKLYKNKQVAREYQDSLSQLHRQILNLLNISNYWPK